MKILLREFSEEGSTLEFDQNTPWLQAVLGEADEKDPHRQLINPSKKSPKLRPVALKIEYRLIDEIYELKGKLDTHLVLVCSRCANDFDFPCHRKFNSLYTKDEQMAGAVIEQQDGTMHYQRGHQGGLESLKEVNDQDVDVEIELIEENFIELESVLSEQLALSVPFQPLCRADCKGICANCGADWNLGRCACDRLNKASPFEKLSRWADKLSKSKK